MSKINISEARVSKVWHFLYRIIKSYYALGKNTSMLSSENRVMLLVDKRELQISAFILKVKHVCIQTIMPHFNINFFPGLNFYFYFRENVMPKKVIYRAPMITILMKQNETKMLMAKEMLTAISIARFARRS